MGPVRILLLEDSELDEELAVMHLRKGGIDFSLRRVSTREGFTHELNEGGYDIILADYVVPGFDGIAALEIAREMARDVPFVFVSGGLGEELAIDLLKRGAVDYVLKNRLERLAPAVRRAVAEAKERQERLQAQQALREMNETLEQRVVERTAQLRALTSELTRTEQRERRRLAQVLHDHLQQLLVAAKMQLDLSAGRRGPEQQQRATQRVRELLDESIQVSRSLTVELSPPVLYDASFDAALHWLADHFEEKHHLKVHVEAQDVAEVHSENLRVFLFEAVRELLFNIVKHAGVDTAEVTLCREDDQHVLLTVTDRGKGFEAEEVGGAGPDGFGLFSIRERLKLLGCAFTLQSAPGDGTQITIRAPAPRIEAAQVQARDEVGGVGEDRRPDSSVRGLIRILLADDHKVLREGLAGLLEQERGMRVIAQAGNGEEAVRLAGSLRPDVIVMDVTMPLIDGIEATRRIASQWPDIQVIGLSMHDDPHLANNMRKAGAAEFLTKGGPVEDVSAAIRRCALARAK